MALWSMHFLRHSSIAVSPRICLFSKLGVLPYSPGVLTAWHGAWPVWGPFRHCGSRVWAHSCSPY